jgi:hypothetical protein
MPIDKKTCLEWQRYRDKAGYGHKRFRGKDMLAHRVAWIQAYGPIPMGMNVLHRCDNPPCVNPLHLFLGSQVDNIKDCKAKGRISRASRNVGAKHGNSKIQEQTAVKIKMLYGVVSPHKIGKALGMNPSSIHDIMTGKNWKHVTANTRYSI